MAKLASSLQANIDVRLGNFGDRKSLEGGIFELRFQFGAGYRVYFGLEGNQIVLLLVGGSKKRQDPASPEGARECLPRQLRKKTLK